MTTAVVRLPRLLAARKARAHGLRASVRLHGRVSRSGGGADGDDLAWITVAMVGARTVAMGLNRLIDAEIDARNPRTAARELPSGALTPVQAAALCVVALAVFLAAVFQLDPVVRWLWPIPVVLFVVYPYLKRVTWLCHVWLGVSLGLAPVGAWLAVSGSAPWEAWALAGAVALWVAGFEMSTPSSISSTTSGKGFARGRSNTMSQAGTVPAILLQHVEVASTFNFEVVDQDVALLANSSSARSAARPASGSTASRS